MAHLIDKDALVAEIKRLRDTAFELYGCSQFDSAYNNVLKSIDTLEVKEVDLEKELDSMITPELKFHKALLSLFYVAKHFFELGIKVGKEI